MKMADQILKNYSMLESVFSELKNFIKPGITELDIYNYSKMRLEQISGGGLELECCIGSGVNSSNPDCQATSRSVEDFDVVLVDLFPKICGWYCDITRTFIIGDNRAACDFRHKLAEVMIQNEKYIRNGVRAVELDHLFRQDVIKIAAEKGYRHHTGHGIGELQVALPAINKNSDDILRTGDIVAIEPGIYISGQFGIRLENTYIVTDNIPICINRLKLEL